MARSRVIAFAAGGPGGCAEAPGCCAETDPPWAAAANAIEEARRAERTTSVSSRGDLREQTQAEPGDQGPGQGAALRHVARRDQPESDQQRRPEREDIENREQLHR